MKTKILEYIDFEKVNTLLEGFNQSTGFVTAILDLDGNVLSKSGWRQICTEFHRVNSETSKRCTISDTVLAGELKKGEKYHFYKCLNGLVDVAVPIIIKGEHIANLFSGQFFIEKPDHAFFQKQAAQFGFNETVYIKALGDVPVIAEEKVKTIMEFLLNMTQLISDMTLQRIELIELNVNLQESEKRFKLLFENAPLSYQSLDKNATLIDINPQWLKTLGYNREEVIGRYFGDFMTPESAKLITERFPAFIAAGEISDYQFEMIRKDGSHFIVSYNGKIGYDELGHFKQTHCIFQDITDRKHAEILLKEKSDIIEAQNEEYLQLNEELSETNQDLIVAKEHAEESDRLKTAFLQNMSHEIRTPMNAIMGFSNLLPDNFDNKTKLKNFTTIITQRCSDLLDLINDILDLSKIESGQLPVNIDECNLNEIFDELHQFFVTYHQKNDKKHIGLHYTPVQSNQPAFILTDKGKLKQIFINLIANAFKFTDNGSISFGLSAVDNNHLTFFVSDTGIGIPANKHDLVFERFMQLTTDGYKAKGGTGLGLPIVKGLAKLIGGDVTLISKEGKGTTFSFSVSYKIASTHKHVHDKKIVQSVINWQAYTVLIVEDDEYNAEYLKEILSGTGINILTTESGEQCVEIVESDPTINIILMDIRMHGMSGLEATTIIKRKKPQIKIIAQTAYASNNDHQMAIDAGCDDYISKPVNQALLISKINELLIQ